MILHLFNGAASAFAASVLLFCIFSVRVNDGLFIKIGLISMAIGEVFDALFLFRAAYYSWTPDPVGIGRAHLAVNVGIAVAIAGHFFRRWRAGKPLRKVTDYMPLMTEPLIDSLPSQMFDEPRRPR